MEVIGRVDKIDIPDFQLENIPVKVDTGANRSAIHCSQIRHNTQNGQEEIVFHIPLDASGGVNVFSTRDFFKKRIKSSSGHVEERFVVKVDVILFGKKIKTSFSLTNRVEMKYPILLGRKLLNSRFVVDVSQENLSFKKKNENSYTFQKP
jgi:hypothetical protein